MTTTPTNELTIRPGVSLQNTQKFNHTRNFFVSKVRLLVAMVGLPARGKSYTANKLTIFLQWLGIRTRVFNVGEYRRQILDKKSINQSAEFFEPGNDEAKKTREKLATDVLSQILAWLDEGGEVAIFDATNTTKERRTQIIDTCNQHEPRVPVIFIENICDDPNVLAENFKQKILNSPDYKGVPIQEATQDLRRRIHNYETVYRTIEDDALTYIKIINLQSKVICNRVSGSIPQMLTGFLMSLHTQTRPIWFTRPVDCETIDPKNPKTLITATGERYAQRLADMISKRLPARLKSKLIIFTGTSTQALQTAKYIAGAIHVQTTSLNKMQTGECRDMSTKILQQKMPEIYKAWDADRFNYRFPGGESFSDLVQRLRQLVIELEQLVVPALVISHQAPIQALYCYFKGKDVQLGPLLAVPSHTVIELVSTQHGWNEKHFKLMPRAKTTATGDQT